MSENIFNDQLEDEQEDDITIDVLVGEARKYKDGNALAKAYVNAEEHIETLKRDLTLAREAANKPTSPTEEDGTGQNNTPVQSSSTQLKEEDWRSRIREELKVVSEEEKAKTNLNTVQARMLEQFGDERKANAAIVAKASELGVTTKWLEDMAIATPNAFFQVIGVTNTTPNGTPTPRSEKNTNANFNPTSGERGYSYYRELSRTNKSTYFSPATQKEIMDQRKRLGTDFYKI
jgi:hypothetical protein